MPAFLPSWEREKEPRCRIPFVLLCLSALLGRQIFPHSSPVQSHTVRGTGGERVRGVAVLTITGVLSQLVGFVYRIGLTRLAGAEILGL